MTDAARAEKGPTPEQYEKIRGKLQAGLDKLVVHGDFLYQGEKIELRLRPDLDALGGVYLMDLAGINYNAVQFEHKGSWVPGAVHIDTGGRKQLTVEDDGSIFFDHHAAEKGENTSATQIVYETLVKLGLLKKEKWLDGFVGFVTEIDNLSYPIDKEFFRKEWPHTLYGTYKVLPVRVIADFFKKGKSPREPFTLEEASSTIIKKPPEWQKTETLTDVCNRTSRLVGMSLDSIERARAKMERTGIPGESPELGRVVVNIIDKGKKNRIPMGFTAIKAMGYDTYILWNEEHKSFFLNPARDADKIYEKVVKDIPSAKLIRGTMIICPPTEADKNLTLGALLRSVGLREGDKKMPEKEPQPPEKEPQPPQKESPGVAGFLDGFREKLNEKLADDKISDDDFDKRVLAIARIKKAATPQEALSVLDEEYADSKFDLEEYRRLKNALSEKEGDGKEQDEAGEKKVEPLVAPDAAREAKKSVLGEKINRMQEKLSVVIAEGKLKPEYREKVDNALAALERLRVADDPAAELKKIAEEGLLPSKAVAEMRAIIEDRISPGKQEQKPAGETKPDAGKPASPEGAPKGPAIREGVKEPPPRLKTPEEMHRDALRLLTYQLCEADWSVQRPEDIPSSFVFTAEMEARMENLLKEKNEYVQAFAQRIQAQQDVARLEKERDRMEREQDPKLGAIEKNLVWARNALGHSEIPDSGKLEEAKEKVKVRIMDEFRKSKWAYIQENKDGYIRNYTKEWMKKHHKYPGYEKRLTDADKEQMLKEILEEDVLTHAERVMVESVARLDNNIEFEKEKAAAKAQGIPEAAAQGAAPGAVPTQEGAPAGQEAAPKKWWQRVIGRFQKLPAPARIAISAATGTAIGVGFVTAGFITAPAGLALYAGQRLFRGALGGAFGAGIYKLTKGVTDWANSKIFGKIHQFRRGRHIKDTRKQMKEAIGDSQEWMEDEAKKLKLAKIIDAQAREWNKKIASTAKWEKGGRIGWGIAAGIAGGYLAGNLVDAFTGHGVPPTTISDALEKGKGDSSYQGLADRLRGEYPEYGQIEPEASISQIPIPVEPGAAPGAEGYAAGDMLDFSGGEPYGPEGYHVPGGEPAGIAEGMPQAGIRQIPIPGGEPVVTPYTGELPPGVPLDAENIPAAIHPSPDVPVDAEDIPASYHPSTGGAAGAAAGAVSPDAAAMPSTGSGYALGLEGARPEDWQFSDIVQVKTGDNVTNILRGKLNAYGKLNGLNPAQQIFAADYMRLQAGKHLSEIGLQNIDQLKPGQTLDFSSVLTQENMNAAVEGAKALDQAGMNNIMQQSAKLSEWVQTHKGQALTPDRINEILHGPKEMPHVVTQTMPFNAPPPTVEFQPIQGGPTAPFESPELGDASYSGPPPPASYSPPSSPDYPGYPAGPEPGADLRADVIPPPPAGPPPAPPPGPPPAALPESSSPGGGVVTAEAAPILSPLEAAFGSRAEYAIANQYGFQLGEYGAIKDTTVGELLNQIPSRHEAWRIFGGQIPDRTITLPHYGWAHWNWEFAKQVQLAEFISSYKPQGEILKLSVSQFLQMVVPR